MCLLGMANTRMKDYYDLWVLLAENTLDPTEVRRAIEATFERRKMTMPPPCLQAWATLSLRTPSNRRSGTRS